VPLRCRQIILLPTSTGAQFAASAIAAGLDKFTVSWIILTILINQQRLTQAGGYDTMAARRNQEPCCPPGGGRAACCKVESLVSVDERGQMVLPKEIRERANIRAGDKFALVSYEKDGKVCCLSLVRAEELASMVKEMLGPVMKEVL
jgi:AbrB family looped-hinge helix DNA binding protein